MFEGFGEGADQMLDLPDVSFLSFALEQIEFVSNALLQSCDRIFT